jgi:hypothetical protein
MLFHMLYITKVGKRNSIFDSSSFIYNVHRLTSLCITLFDVDTNYVISKLFLLLLLLDTCQ